MFNTSASLWPYCVGDLVEFTGTLSYNNIICLLQVFLEISLMSQLLFTNQAIDQWKTNQSIFGGGGGQVYLESPNTVRGSLGATHVTAFS